MCSIEFLLFLPSHSTSFVWPINLVKMVLVFGHKVILIVLIDYFFRTFLVSSESMVMAK